MPRVDLAVPYDDKDEAKGLGARWDGAAKVWYVPDGVDAAPFTKWAEEKTAPSPTEPTVRCNRFYLAQSDEMCWQCKAETRVFAFILPQGWDKKQDSDEPFAGRWLRQESEAALWRLTWLCRAALEAIVEHGARFSLDSSKGFLPTKFFNHCDHCGAKLKEPGSAGGHAFQPEEAEDAARITLHYYNQPFEASCHYPDDAVDGWLRAMTRAEHGSIETRSEEEALRRYLVE